MVVKEGVKRGGKGRGEEVAKEGVKRGGKGRGEEGWQRKG